MDDVSGGAQKENVRLPGEKASVSFNGIYEGEIGSWSMETLQGHFLRSSLRKSKEIKCTNRIKIEDANRNDNRNLTLYRIYIYIYTL